MRKAIYKIISFLIILICISMIHGCEENSPSPTRKAVIEGYLCSGDHPYVMFSASVVPGISGNVADAVVNWGKVTISDGDTTVVLTGRVEESTTPPFVYYSFDIDGQPGKTYTISAEFKDLKASGSMRMPFPVAIDSISLAPTASDSLRAATLHFTSPEETPSYFYISMQNSGRGERMRPCMMGTIKTDKPHAHYSIPVLPPKVKIDSTQYISQFKVGEDIIIGLNRIEKPIYDFWKAYDDMVMFTNSPFITTSESLPTNITGGYGIWSVEGSSQMELKVE